VTNVRWRREGGSVSLLAAAAMVVIAVLAMASADLARVLRARSEAQTAADAAALAAAQELALPSESDPRQPAEDMAARNGATLVACDCSSGSFEAVVEVQVPVGAMMLLRGVDSIIARARAVVDVPGPGSSPAISSTGAG
jgi:secretion/DNA translocation related TadE-like protein